MDQGIEKNYVLAKQLKTQVARLIFGQEDLITEALCAFLCSGHILITGAPGLAKTTLVRVLAHNLGLSFGRVQFTPDLLPSDIIGCDILNMEQGSMRRSFEFSPGPIFVHLLLADEINRASPRTQSAMLEAMQERKVTVGGKIHELALPFMVFATQNPFESEGTFPLPEAQLDRFLLHTLVAYPHEDAELKILQEHAQGALVGEQFGAASGQATQAAPLSLTDIQTLLAGVKRIRIHDELLLAINELVRSTRPEDEQCPQDMRDKVWYGAGPRAGLSLISATRALALLEGEETVRWRHVRRLAKPVLRHRIKLSRFVDKEKNVDGFIDLLLTRLEDRHLHLAKGLS